MATQTAEEFRVNGDIDAREVRLVDAEGRMVGVVSLREAFARADDAGLDLVEVSPTAAPPVSPERGIRAIGYPSQA